VKTLALSLAAALCVTSMHELTVRAHSCFSRRARNLPRRRSRGRRSQGLRHMWAKKVAGTTNAFEPRVMNDPVKAAEYCSKSKVVLGIVTPAFI